MKRLARSAAALLLAVAARAVVRRYRPKVVMVTGSVGKTATKEAVAAALSARYLVRKSEKSFNSEFGVPFTILGVGNPWDNPVAWIVLLRRALALLVLPNHYPNLLVLEVAADHPGDLAKILRIATPDAVVVTRLPEIPVHVEAYAGAAAVREEEFSPALALPAGAPLIVSADDPFALELAAGSAARLSTFGYAAEAGARIEDAGFLLDGEAVVGMRGRLALAGESAEVCVRGAAGETQLLPLAAAAAAAAAFDISLADAVEALASYEPPPGRCRLLAGARGAALIDDTYNSSPAALAEAFATLAAFPHASRRVAVLGDMLELGRYSVMEHERMGEKAAAVADLLVTVGIRAKGLAAAAIAAGMPESNVRSFDDAHAAAAALPALIGAGDVVLLKGSQGIRLERVARALLADPADRGKLARQERAWQRIA
ncbi:MAG: hypothetical protein KGI78_02940 [Patescibacteria group bacterium]|nr:hypothetical protein [Patescibacteria group bacterium]MDE1944006.1 hypothetical protein [Patescibacteria group bacterium]MDE1945152.1 hypothetical protein [Patescibacteria group bacterium]MDE2057786.1 hypothetical protein [Patescibacteria group bacterium]